MIKKTKSVVRPSVRQRAEPMPAPAPINTRLEKAGHLPLSGPGIVVRVPLHLLIEYLELHGLHPNGIREPKVQPERGPGEAILLVRREPKGEKTDG